MKERVKVKGQMRLYLQWPLILSLLLIAANAAVGAMDVRAGMVMAVFTIVYIAIAIHLYFQKRSSLLADMVEFASEYAWVQKLSLIHI